MSIKTLLLLLIVSAIASPAWAEEWHVSPEGKPDAAGTREAPWDLKTALAHPERVQPGDTIWLKGGAYKGSFTSTLKGAKDKPIIVRAVPGARATLRQGHTRGMPILYVHGSHTWFWGMEHVNVGTHRGGDKRSVMWTPHRGHGVLLGHRLHPVEGIRMINMVVHDAQTGFWLAIHANDIEATGNLLYHNGYDYNVAGAGGGIFTQNKSDTVERIRENLIFGGYMNGIRAVGSPRAAVRNCLFEGNVIWNSGVASKHGPYANFRVGADSPDDKITIAHNVSYRSTPLDPRTSPGYFNAPPSRADVFIGNSFTTEAKRRQVPNESAVVRGNYWAGEVALWNWKKLTFRENTIVSRGAILAMNNAAVKEPTKYDWDANAYWCPNAGAGPFALAGTKKELSFVDWQAAGRDGAGKFHASKPTATRVFVRPNPYEKGRAHVIIFNWPKKETVDVDVSKVLKEGDVFELRDAENFFGKPVLSGTYAGKPMAVPMNQTEAAQPIGEPAKPYAHTGPEFGAFVVITKGVTHARE